MSIECARGHFTHLRWRTEYSLGSYLLTIYGILTVVD